MTLFHRGSTPQLSADTERQAAAKSRLAGYALVLLVALGCAPAHSDERPAGLAPTPPSGLCVIRVLLVCPRRTAAKIVLATDKV
jgi:hypothetical protein